MHASLLRFFSQISIPEDSLQIPKTQPTNSTVTNVLSLAFAVIGAVAFLLIVLAGLRFSLSKGNAEAAGKARNQIIYAAVGLVVSMMAFAVVRFVVRNI